MKRLICIPVFLLSVFFCSAQLSSGRLEAYMSPGLFSARYSQDSLVAPGMQGNSRLGSLISYGIQYGIPVNHRVSLKAGIGYTTRQYSIVKYKSDLSFLLLFIGIFPGRSGYYDMFPISRVQYNNRYFEVPLSFDYNVSKQKATVQVRFGCNTRLQFLSRAKAGITLEDPSGLANPEAVREVEKRYEDDVKSFVCSFEPYMDVSCRMYKGFGIYYRIKPFSFYASPLNDKTATRQTEYLNGGIGLWYRFE